VEGERDRLPHLYPYAEFFLQFSLESIGRRLPILNGTTGELPKAAKVRTGGAAGKKETSIATLDDGRNHKSAFWLVATVEHPE
jgi:hypothetical protein